LPPGNYGRVTTGAGGMHLDDSEVRRVESPAS
jgi:hypothetical protein